MADLLIKLKQGSIASLAETENDQPVVALDKGTIYFAVDTTRHVGKIVFDAPKGANGVDRIVMSTEAEVADLATRALNADQATTAALAETISGAKIDGITFTGANDILHYGECSTEGSTAAKTVACTGFALTTGARIAVKFANKNTAENMTLSVNGTTAKAVYYNGAQIAANKIIANKVYDFIYDGTVYILVGDLDTNTTYPLADDTHNGLLSASLYTTIKNVDDNATYITVTGSSPIQTSASVGDVTISHAASGVTAGSKGDTTNQTPSWGDTFKAVSGTVNSTGHLSAFADHTITIPSSTAKTTENGLMSAADKIKLNGIDENATYITVNGVGPISIVEHGNTTPASVGDIDIKHDASGVTAASKGDTTNQTPTWGDTVKALSATVNATGHLTALADHTIKIPDTLASDNANGLMSAAQKQKLDTVETNANFTSLTGIGPISVLEHGTSTAGTVGDLDIKHDASGVTAASKGDTSNQTPTWGDTFKVLSGTVNSTGHLSAFADHTVKIPDSVVSTTANGLMKSTDYVDYVQGITIAGKNLKMGDDEWTAAQVRQALGLSNAMHFIGITTTAMSDDLTTAAVSIGGTSTTPQPGDVVISNDTHYEYVWIETNATTHAGRWGRLGPDGSYSLSDHVHGQISNTGTITAGIANSAVVLDANKNITYKDLTATDPTASGTSITFIDTIEQEADGAIVATKKTVRDAGQAQSGVVSTGNQTFSGIKNFVGGVSVVNNSSNNSNDALVYIESKDSQDWGLKVNVDNKNYGIAVDGTGSNLLKVGTNETLVVNNAEIKIGKTGNLVDTKISGDVYPVVTESYELGKSGNSWKGVYIGASDSYGSATQPIYWNDGVPTATTYSLSSTVNAGTANKLAYYSGANAISAGTIDTNGSYLRNIGGYANTSYALSTESAIVNDWIRTKGSTGWYSEDHGGGWYMSDNTWIRSYGSKSIYQNSGILRTDGTFQVGDSGEYAQIDAQGIFLGSTTAMADAANLTTINGHVVINGGYNTTNNYSQGIRINRSTDGWSEVIFGGAQGTTSGNGLGVWLVGAKDTPASATTAAASITDSNFYIGHNEAIAGMRLQGHFTNGWSIRPRLTIGADVDTNYSFKVASGMSYLAGPLRIGCADAAADTGYATANVGSQNYIAFYGVYGDNLGSFNHTYIGESIYGGKTAANEKSELLLFKGNDISGTSGPDRIRLFAGQIDIQVYGSALSGTWDTIRQTEGIQVANFASGQVKITGNVVPEATDTRSLGNLDLHWSNVYIGPNNSYGSGTNPIYWNNGVPTPSSSTVGSATLPVYLNAGTITACTASSVFSSFTSTTNTLSITVAGKNRTANAVNGVSNSWTDGTTTGPTLSTTVNGVTGTAVAIPVNTVDNSGVVPAGSGYANCTWKTDANGNPAWRTDAQAAPIVQTITLLSTGWDTTTNTYTVNNVNATADSLQICSLPYYTYASSDEMDALGAAKLVDGGQGAGYFVLKALGDVPTIDIDIMVVFQYSSADNLTQMQSAAASANAAAASAAQAAASAKVQRKTVTFSSVTSDTSVSPYKYKYEVAWTGVTANDWVDGSGITDQDWAIESATNKVILRFTNNITSSKTVTCYWATTEAA